MIDPQMPIDKAFFIDYIDLVLVGNLTRSLPELRSLFPTHAAVPLIGTAVSLPALYFPCFRTIGQSLLPFRDGLLQVPDRN